MKNCIALIGAAKTPGFADRPLLGKSCREHVLAALEEAGMSPCSEQEAAEASQSPVLWIREEAPCVTGQTLLELCALAAKGKTAILPARFGHAGEVLAAAFPGGALPAPVSQEAVTSAALALKEQPEKATQCDIEPEECVLADDAKGYAIAFSMLRRRINKAHMSCGVILLEPERTVIEANVKIEAGTVIYGGNTLQGHTVIGADCTLYPNNRMENALLGRETTVENSVLLDCSVGSHTTVGPFAFLRPKTRIGDHCRIGDFVEVKNSSIDDGTKVSHLTYVGDSDLGKDINLGCGVVFVNYDGKTKNRSKVEDHAFIGCNCNLVAPVHIGKNAYLAAGGTITEDVPEDALYVARAHGVIKEGWVRRRKEQGKL